MKNLGLIILLIGSIILIYAGFAGTGQSNALIGTGFGLVLVGFVAHILLNKYLGKDA